MEQQFVIPAYTFIVGLGLWLAYFIARLSSNTVKGWPMQVELAVALVTSGVFILSGITCLLAGGPTYGQLMRAGVLLVLAGLTHWKVGAASARVLLFGVLVLGVLAVIAVAG